MTEDESNPYSPPNVPPAEPPRKVVRIDDARHPRVPGPVLIAALLAVAFLYAFISWLRN